MSSPPEPATPKTAPQEKIDDFMAPLPEAPTHRRMRRNRIRIKQSGRVIRYFEPWSVFKISFLLNICLWAVIFLAAAILWLVADGAGLVERLENFIIDLFALETFAFSTGMLLGIFALVAVVMSLVSTLLVVVLCVAFNLTASLFGGVRLLVLEEETTEAMGENSEQTSQLFP